MNVKQINCLAGILPPQVSRDIARQTLVGNLRFAADKLKAAGIRVLIQTTVNTFDMPGYFLSGTRQAVDLIEDTGSDNVFLQYDVYHMQRMEGELANTIQANLPLIKHVQVADNPGRVEPGTGEINYRYLFALLGRIGYDGWSGANIRQRLERSQASTGASDTMYRKAALTDQC